MLVTSTLRGLTPEDPELQRLIQAERVRMLFGASLPVDLSGSVFATVLGIVVSPYVGMPTAAVWIGVCLLVAAIRQLCHRAYRNAENRSDPQWLTVMTVMAALSGATWGVGCAWLMPEDFVICALLAASLCGAVTVNTFSLQAHRRPIAVMSALMLLPPAMALFSRGDLHGAFSAVGLLSMLGLMLMESGRCANRISELLWLRFTTDRIAQERSTALKLAQRNSAVKDRFLATMSHEMRTPLHGILGLARLLRQRLPQQPALLAQSHDQIALIERSGEHLMSIINDVLDFSRIEAGKMSIDPRPIDLHALLMDVVELSRQTAREKGLPLRHDLQIPRPCPVHGDAARLRQVLHNLIGNAIKFTDIGEVCLTVRPVSQSPDAPMLFIVTDAGVGIARDQLAAVFDPFHQIDGAFSRTHQGTGLGLTISREIARAMGGDVVCESTPGQGSVFTFTVPLPAAPGQLDPHPRNEDPPHTAHTPDEPAAPELAPRFRGHLLLAEDNPVNALVAQAILERMGVSSTHVTDGQAALEALQNPAHGYDLVLMDCQMPVLDGIEATRRLRCQEQAQDRPSVPVVALTANVSGSDRERCRAAGMDAHLGKPFSATELATLLQHYLPPESAAAPQG